MNRKEILNKAESIINGDREGTYGKPEDSFDRIAQLWSVYLNHDISSVDVANMMVLLKVARNAGGVYKDDNWIDICGYAALGGEIQSKFDYDSFGQFMNKPVDEQEEEHLCHIGKFGGVHDVKDMEFESAWAAVHAWLEIRDTIKNFGSCTVSDYYGICGGPSAKYSDTKYGWDDTHEIKCEGVISLSKFGKWVITMPPAVKLNGGENK